jgi:hypothetical protein
VALRVFNFRLCIEKLVSLLGDESVGCLLRWLTGFWTDFLASCSLCLMYFMQTSALLDHNGKLVPVTSNCTKT